MNRIFNVYVYRTAHPVCTPGSVWTGYRGEVATYFGRSLELPWKDNARGVSCIPAGTYELAITDSPKFRRPMLEVMHVRNRDGVRVHNANSWRELEGCVAVAKYRPTMESLWWGLADSLKGLVRAAIVGGDLAEIHFFDPNGAD